MRLQPGELAWDRPPLPLLLVKLPAADGQERLGLRQGQRIQARGVTGGKNDDFHVG